MSSYYIELLKEKVESEFGRKIRVSNSSQLSNRLMDRTGQSVSSSTIQRFFGLVAHTSKPSLHTKDVLSEYSGYGSWDDLKKKNSEDVPVGKNGGLILDEFGVTLFKLCLTNHNFETVLTFLDMLPMERRPFRQQLEISSCLGFAIRRDPEARKKLLPELAKRQAGRIYFYENFVDFDYLDVYYNQAVQKHYLSYSDPSDEYKYRSEYVFSRSLAFIGKLRAKREKEAIRIAYDLLQKVPINLERSDFSHPFPYTRLLAVYIIYSHLTNRLSEKRLRLIHNKLHELLLWGMEEEHKNYDGSDYPPPPNFVLARIIVALHYCERYQEVLEFYAAFSDFLIPRNTTTDNFSLLRNCVEHAAVVIGRKIRIPKLSPTHLLTADERNLHLNKPLN